MNQVKTKLTERTFPALGTVNNIRIFGGERNRTIRSAVERVTEIEQRMSAFLPESDISLLSRKAGLNAQKLHEDTFHLLRKALKFSAMSDGAFDVTVRPLVELWGIGKKGSFVPSDAEIQQTLSLVNYKTVKLDGTSHEAFLGKPGQSVDLGGIAKGYAADEVRRVLLENDVRDAIVNLGGNVIAMGLRPDGQSWKIGIQNPLAPTGSYLGTLSVSNRTVVTSGCNERFFIRDGVRYHHILDPRTGKPAQNSLLSVTAVSECSTDADALTTALFILGPEKGISLLKAAKAEAIFVFNDLSVAVTNGLKNKFQFIVN